MSVKLNNIEFKNTDGLSKQSAKAAFVNKSSLTQTAFDKLSPSYGSDEYLSKYSLVNGLQIDWNGAKLDNVSLPNVLDDGNTVNTTGQLLALINDLQEQINAIVYIMNGGNQGGDSTGGTTTTTTSSTITPPPGQITTTTSTSSLPPDNIQTTPIPR